MSFSKRQGKNTPQCYTKPLDSLKNWNNRFFWVDECVFPTAVDWRTNASKDGMPANGTYSIEAVRALDTHRTLIQKQSEMLLCMVGISRRYYLGDDVYPTFHYDDDEFDSCPKSDKGKDWEPPQCPHEVPLLTLTSARDIEMDEPAAATDSSGVPSAIEKGRDGIDATAPPKSLRRDHAGPRPSGAPADVSDPDPLSFVDAPSHHPATFAQSSQGVAAAEDPESENVSSPAEVGSPGSVYRPEWDITNGSLLDTPEACQDLVARQDQRIQARESEIKNLEALLETEASMKRAAEEKSDGLSQELERIRAQFSKLQVSNERLSQQVDALQQQVSGEETLKAAFEEYKRQQDRMVEQRCAEMDARLDALSIDFDEELYPHMLTAIAGRRRVIGHGLGLALMKYAESLEMRQAFADVVSAGVAKEAKAKFTTALQSLKDLKYPLLDQLEGLKDAPMDVIMAALYLESDTGGCPIIYTRPPSQLLSACHPRVPGANISRAEKKKKCRIVCRTHGVGSAHHARSDGVLVSVPTVVPQGLALLLVDAATQTDLEDA
nr:hypothetical protein [Tanacetum cinerariifolium]